MRKRPYIPVELDAKAQRVKDDPDAYAVAGQHVLGGIADENYARAILSGMDHYTAKMVSREDAGFKVDRSARIGDQSDRDRLLIDQLKQRYELEDLRMEASRMAGERMGLPEDRAILENLLDEQLDTNKSLNSDLNKLVKELKDVKEDSTLGSKKNTKRLAGIVLAALAGGAGTNEIIEYLQGPTIEETEYYR